MDSANGNVVVIKGTAYYVVGGVEYPAVTVCPEGNENLTAEAQFYYLKNSVQ